MRFYLFLVIILELSNFRAMALEKMSLRDKEYKEEHLKNLSVRKGYQGNKDWDNFIKMSSKYKDEDIIKKMLKVEPTSPTENAQYIYDLFLVYKSDPDFFIEISSKFYHQNMDCVARIFKTNPMILKESEISLMTEGKNNSDLFKTFSKVIRTLDYTKISHNENVKTIAKCQSLKIKLD